MFDVTDYVVMKLYRPGLDLRHGPPAYESDMLPGMLSFNENGKCLHIDVCSDDLL